jgi:hypothetical protein
MGIFASNRAARVQIRKPSSRRKRTNRPGRAHLMPIPIHLINTNVNPMTTIGITTLCTGKEANVAVVHRQSAQVRKIKNRSAYKIFLAATMLAGLWKSGVGGTFSIVLGYKVTKIFHLVDVEH